MKKFLIADLVNFSGVKAHTIRIWEQRHQIIQPTRGEGNIRYYTLEDIDYLLKISLLNKTGFRISLLALMDPDTLEKHLLALEKEVDKQDRQIHKLILNMFAGDIEEFETVLDSCMLYWGIDITFKNIIIPFLERVRLFSCKNCDVEVDFVITTIRKKLIVGIENTSPDLYKNKTALLFLPKGEYFDLLLLYFNYIIKGSGIKVLYMGTNVSIQKLRAVSSTKQPDFLLTYLSPRNHRGLNDIIEYLNEESTLKCFITRFDNTFSKEIDDSNVRFLHYTESYQAIS